MNGKIYLVATPIGNLEDMTLRAIKTLKEVDIIAAEDTRHTLKLLNHFEIKKPLISYHRHNEETKSDTILEIVKQGKNVAIVSDAGTPGISDPGEEIVKAAIENKIEIIPIPGACAFINALIISGLDTKEFIFLGFLPLNKNLRKDKLKKIELAKETVIIYEAPHKLKQTLKDLENILENRRITVAREITKIHEEFVRGTASELLDIFQDVKGEIVLIIEKSNKELVEDRQNLNNLTLEEHYKYYEKKGYEKKEIIKKIAKDRNVNKNEIYKKFI